MLSLEQSDEPHEEYHQNSTLQPHKKHSKLKKVLFIIAVLMAIIIVGLTIGFAVLFFSLLGGVGETMPEALNDAWQTVLGWTKPVTNLYDQTMKLIPGNN